MPTTSSSKATDRRCDETTDVVVRIASSMKEVPAPAWDRCANPSIAGFDPFVSHAFLSALEESGSASPDTGWAPHHLLVEDGVGGLSAVMPLYLKGHSYGEYIFDHAWADAFERAGGRYYPKLLAAVPFTPATGRRLLTRADADQSQAEEILTAGMVALARRHGISSIHVNFADKAQWLRLGARDFLLRQDQQFHWTNENYESFEHFLAALSSRKRKQIRHEREAARADGITIRWITGRDLKETHWDVFFKFYMDTGGRKWGKPYLTRKFFSLIGERMADRLLIVLCERAGRPIAGALNVIGGNTLFGRYWGCLEDHRFLHFEACYYQAIDFALAHGLARVEAGAQGTHKLARGYLPVPTYSAHWIAEPHFRTAIARYLDAERRAVEAGIEELASFAPFRRDRAMPAIPAEDHD